MSELRRTRSVTLDAALFRPKFTTHTISLATLHCPFSDRATLKISSDSTSTHVAHCVFYERVRTQDQLLRDKAYRNHLRMRMQIAACRSISFFNNSWRRPWETSLEELIIERAHRFRMRLSSPMKNAYTKQLGTIDTCACLWRYYHQGHISSIY